jgi:hypothetical protein
MHTYMHTYGYTTESHIISENLFIQRRGTCVIVEHHLALLLIGSVIRHQKCTHVPVVVCTYV